MKNKGFLALQLFAESTAPQSQVPQNNGATQLGTGGTDPTPTKTATQDPKEPPAQKPDAKYTDDDLDKIINQKFAKWQEDKQKELDEAKRLAGMSAQEKTQHELKVAREQLDKLMKQQTLTEMTKTARSILAEKDININDDLLSMLVSDDADKTKSTIDSFVSLFQDAVKKAVTEALKGSVPRAGSSSGLTKEQILAVKNRAERQKLIKENMNLFQ